MQISPPFKALVNQPWLDFIKGKPTPYLYIHHIQCFVLLFFIYTERVNCGFWRCTRDAFTVFSVLNHFVPGLSNQPSKTPVLLYISIWNALIYDVCTSLTSPALLYFMVFVTCQWSQSKDIQWEILYVNNYLGLKFISTE